MRKIALLIALFLLMGLLAGCTGTGQTVQIAATTQPVYEFTTRLCAGTHITVGRVVNENISCLHDYTLQVSQMRVLESADLVIISGAGLEDFMADALQGKQIVDSSAGTHRHEHSHEGHHDHHDHDQDPHIWLSPENAKQMARNICAALTADYPQHADTFSANLQDLLAELDQLEQYGKQTLSDLTCRELITFHDGFSYFAESFDLQILRAVEEESGSEVSAAELAELIELVQQNQLPAVFTERNGSKRAAGIICAETGAQSFTLDMGLSGNYFEAMYHNIDTIKEALG